MWLFRRRKGLSKPNCRTYTFNNIGLNPALYDHVEKRFAVIPDPRGVKIPADPIPGEEGAFLDITMMI